LIPEPNTPIQSNAIIPVREEKALVEQQNENVSTASESSFAMSAAIIKTLGKHFRKTAKYNMDLRKQQENISLEQKILMGQFKP